MYIRNSLNLQWNVSSLFCIFSQGLAIHLFFTFVQLFLMLNCHWRWKGYKMRKMLRLLTEAEDAHELMTMPSQKTNKNCKEKTNNSMQNTLYKTKA